MSTASAFGRSAFVTLVVLLPYSFPEAVRADLSAIDMPGESVLTSTPIDFEALDETTCGCMDVVFLVNDTGSMDRAIANLRSGFQEILEVARLRAATDIRAGLIKFKDDVRVITNLTADLNVVSHGLDTIVADGGNDEPEASDEALREMRQQTECLRQGSSRIDVLAYLTGPLPQSGFGLMMAGGMDALSMAARRRRP